MCLYCMPKKLNSSFWVGCNLPKMVEHGMENVSFPVYVLFFLLRGWIGGCHWRITGSTKRNKVCKAQLSPELCKGRVQLSSRFCYRLFAGTSPLPNITTKKEEIQKTWKYWQKHKTFPHALILIQWKVITFLMDNSIGMTVKTTVKECFILPSIHEKPI